MLTVVYILLGAVLLAGLIPLSLFVVYPRLNYKNLPSGAGASGEQFEVKSSGGIPYLVTNGLPYPTHFEDSSRERRSLTGTWKFRPDPEDRGVAEEWYRREEDGPDWEDMAVPSVFNAADSGRTSYEGLSWYVRTFTPPAAPSAGGTERVRLCFEGVLLRSAVYLNGRKLTEREGGYTPFYLDITEDLKPGEDNVLALRVDNRSTWESIPPLAREDHNPGWHLYGGIYRDVYLEVLPERNVFKAVARTIREDGGVRLGLDILVHSRNRPGKYRLSVRVTGPGGETAAEYAADGAGRACIEAHRFILDIPSPRLWSPETPDLYNVEITAESAAGSDRVSFRTGLRTVEVKDETILLNGKSLFLKGISKHEDDPVLGASQSEETIARDLNLVRELGANYIRTAHYPHDVREMLKIRDMGLLVSQEIPFYQVGTGFTAWFEEKQSLRNFPARVFGMRQMNHRPLLLNAQKQLIEMVERDINNPAILFWSAGNECYTLFRDGGKVFGWLRSVAKAFDPGRPVTMAELTYDIPLFDNNRRAAEHMDIISVNAYYGWYYGKKEDIGPHLDRLHSLYPGKPILVSEFGAGAAPGRRESDGVWKADRVAWGKTYSEDYQEELIGHYLKALKERPWVRGLSPWVLSDFYNTWFPENPVPNYNLKGITSRERKPKRAYYLLQKEYAELKDS